MMPAIAGRPVAPLERGRALAPPPGHWAALLCADAIALHVQCWNTGRLAIELILHKLLSESEITS
jgi:hypothetical protein